MGVSITCLDKIIQFLPIHMLIPKKKTPFKGDTSDLSAYQQNWLFNNGTLTLKF